METKIKSVVSVVVGIVITLITGMINVSGALVGASIYGLPLAWQRTLVTATPITQILWLELIIDIVIWSAITFSLLHFLTKGKK